MISKLNFLGNLIDLRSVELLELISWMSPPPSSRPRYFKVPADQLLRFSGTIPDQEMFMAGPRTEVDHNDATRMMLKHGSATKLTAGRLNSVRAFVREYADGVPGPMSREMAVLPRSGHWNGPFADCGDSGAAVVDGVGRVCGMIIGGDGSAEDTDCTFVTSVNFLVKRLAVFGIEANIFPLPADL